MADGGVFRSGYSRPHQLTNEAAPRSTSDTHNGARRQSHLPWNRHMNYHYFPYQRDRNYHGGTAPTTHSAAVGGCDFFNDNHQHYKPPGGDFDSEYHRPHSNQQSNEQTLSNIHDISLAPPRLSASLSSDSLLGNCQRESSAIGQDRSSCFKYKPKGQDNTSSTGQYTEDLSPHPVDRSVMHRASYSSYSYDDEGKKNEEPEPFPVNGTVLPVDCPSLSLQFEASSEHQHWGRRNEASTSPLMMSPTRQHQNGVNEASYQHHYPICRSSTTTPNTPPGYSYRYRNDSNETNYYGSAISQSEIVSNPATNCVDLQQPEANRSPMLTSKSEDGESARSSTGSSASGHSGSDKFGWNDDDSPIKLCDPGETTSEKQDVIYTNTNPFRHVQPHDEALIGVHTARAQSAVETWYRLYNDLIDYKRKYGHCNVPQKWLENKQLGIWVNKQRMEYKHWKDGEKSAMTELRIRLLNNVGFAWAKRKGQHAWDVKFCELKEYKRRNGDCKVPTKYRLNSSLGRFVSTQRSEYKKYKLGEKCRISRERIDKLNKIGFVWKAEP